MGQLLYGRRQWTIPRVRDTQRKGSYQRGDAPVLADPNFSMDFHSTRAVASKGGDMVYSQGVYTMTMTDPKTKKSKTDKGKFLTLSDIVLSECSSDCGVAGHFPVTPYIDSVTRGAKPYVTRTQVASGPEGLPK